MKISIYCISLTLLVSCWDNNEDWRDNLIGTVDTANSSTLLDCESAIYPDWETSEYFLPYPVGKSYTIGLGHCDGSYHSKGLPDQFAIDFNMSIGEKILASRSGTVIGVEESGIDGGFPNNYVLVRHQDDTYAWYMHLTNNGAAVRVGDNVSRGSLVGYSGSTGLAGYPHLHLVFTFEATYPYNSFPATFKNTIPNERSLQQGTSYPAYSN